MKEPNPAPIYACMYPGLCERAREHGYALAVHGSMVSDFDLVAIPWTEDAAEPEVMIQALMDLMSACFTHENTARFFGVTPPDDQWQHADPEQKPHGRVAHRLHLWHGKSIDLSVMPRHPATD